MISEKNGGLNRRDRSFIHFNSFIRDTKIGEISFKVMRWT